jgi:mannose-6-phosphate isomerase-like protein (cupin superfamily)
MWKVRKTVVAGLAVAIAIGGVWLSRAMAQEQAPSTYSFVTIFDHKKVEASFDKALTEGGGRILFRRNSPQGIYRVNTQSRESVLAACPKEGCFHKGFTAVVYVVSGSATLVLGNNPVNAKVAGPDKFGGEALKPGESHRISGGDVVVVPPDRIHWYKDVTPPFRYLEVQTP